jgi:Rps23 Pro-64 3,4-dihydroxylase Tpa1-like proline 4-hydroxylase
MATEGLAPAIDRRTTPFTWAVVDRFLDKALAQQLALDFPTDGFRTAGTQAKLFRVRSLVVNSQIASTASDLPESWMTLAEIIAAPGYARWLGQVVGRDLNGLRLDASLCRYPPGCSLQPHTDRDIRVTTHIIYFNEEWRAEWGGMLCILRSANIDDVVDAIPPQLHTSVVMLRSDYSWHAVTPVAEGVQRERLSLLVHTSLPDG